MKVRVASAGTGKTTSLVRRYLELVDSGVPLGRVAGVTFTRAAADELRQRVAAGLREVLAEGSYLGGYFTPGGDHRRRFSQALDALDGAVLSTIHGFMIAGLRIAAPSLGLDPGFTLLGEWEAAAVFEEECTGLLLLAADPAHPLHGARATLGSAALELLLDLFGKRSLAPALTFGAGAGEAALEALYRRALASYDARLGAASLAPGEVERRAMTLLAQRLPRERLVARFPHVLVDEYQDVNPIQGAFFEALAAAGARLEVVGDPKQSIYGFRNADVAVFRRAYAAARASGEVQPPLTETRRHARALVAFLNRLTERLAARERGFGPAEAPEVMGAGTQARSAGSVELLVVEGDERLDVLRGREAEVLAERLRARFEAGVPYEEMAVLARSHGALGRVRAALAAEGVPALLVQGRGYYERSEIRDLRHALATGADPTGPGLLPFLRGPFAGLTLPEIGALAAAPETERAAMLLERHPAVATRLERLAELARGTPLEAVKGVLREPLLDGRRFQELLRPASRENVDALLFEVAAQAPRDLAIFLGRLDLLARQAEAGEVPQRGEGVRLVTIHASKGLEFRVVGVFDTGAYGRTTHSPLLVEPGSGAVRLAGAEGFAEAQADAWARQAQEEYRLLYVAASRARDALVLTGSRRRGRAGPWLAALLDLGLTGPTRLPDVTLEVVPYRPPAPAPRAAATPGRVALPPAPWLAERRAPGRLPALVSPSALTRLRARDGEDDEPLRASEGRAGADEVELGRVGWGRARGTLVHYAIGQDWRPDDPATLETLRAQEVLVPFGPSDREGLVSEVLELLEQYWCLVGTALPALADRSKDRAEVPLAVSRGGVVWEGVVDRLYEVRGGWFLDDYKTDRVVAPERYHVQLAHYLDATERALGVRPRGRLVFLRHGVVIEPDRAALDTALAGASR